MGEYANQPATSGPVVQQSGGGSSGAPPGQGGGSSAHPGTGTGAEPAPTQPQAGGGGSQADQSGPEGFTIPDMGGYEFPEWGQYGPTGEVVNPDGSKTTLRHDGNWEYTDSSGRTGVYGDDGAWYDEATGEPMPEGFRDPSFPTTDYTASDEQDWAGRLQDAARRAEEAGYPEQADQYRQKYREAVQRSNELGGQNPRRG